MSRVGKMPVAIPKGVSVDLKRDFVSIKGPLGALEMTLSANIDVKHEGDSIVVNPVTQEKTARMMWGTTRKLIQNMVDGVTKGFKITLEIEGVGYKASVQGANLVMQLGYSHDVVISIPEGISIKCEKPTTIVLSSINRHKLGQLSAKIRSFRIPEPYKGKGIRYSDEIVVRKEGKKK